MEKEEGGIRNFLIQFAFHPKWWIGVWNDLTIQASSLNFECCIHNLITIWYHSIFFIPEFLKDWWLHATWIWKFLQVKCRGVLLLYCIGKQIVYNSIEFISRQLKWRIWSVQFNICLLSLWIEVIDSFLALPSTFSLKCIWFWPLWKKSTVEKPPHGGPANTHYICCVWNSK